MTQRTNSITLFHVSPRLHYDGISKKGLLTSEDRRGNHRIWLCNGRKLRWAIEHVRQRHTVCLVDVWICFRRRYQVIRHRDGIWYSLADIPPEHVCWSADLSNGCPIAIERPCQYME